MNSLELYRFLDVAARAARECGQVRLALAIEAEGPRCRVSDHCQNLFAQERFMTELEVQLREEEGFAPTFQIPTALFKVGEVISLFFRDICEIAGVRPDSAQALKLA
jgi:hypothetical protein